MIGILLALSPAATPRLSLVKACETPKEITFQGGGCAGTSGIDYDPARTPVR